MCKKLRNYLTVGSSLSPHFKTLSVYRLRRGSSLVKWVRCNLMEGLNKVMVQVDL